MLWNNSVMMYSSRVGDVPGCSGTSDVSTEVEKDGPDPKRRLIPLAGDMVTRRLIPLAGDGVRPSCLDVPLLERSRELLDKAFDNGMAVFQMCSILILFPLVPRLHDCLF